METIKKLITELIALLTQYLAQKPAPPVETQPQKPEPEQLAPINSVSAVTGGKKLELKMISFLHEKLKDNGLYIDAVKKRDARTVMRLAAQVCVGIRESGGNNKGAMVELIQETIGTAGAEAWCMSFVQTCIAFAEYTTGVKSKIYASEHCMTTWRKTPSAQRVKNIPAAGAIAIWNHTGGDSGHTGIVDSCDGTNFKAFEGNTESGVNPTGIVVRDGGGVYHTKRSLKGAGSMRLVGFLIPF